MDLLLAYWGQWDKEPRFIDSFMIVMASEVNVRNTRNTDSLNVYIPKPNIECYRQSFTYAGGKIWNDLPINIQNAPSVEAFKYAYKKLNFKHRNTH